MRNLPTTAFLVAVTFTVFGGCSKRRPAPDPTPYVLGELASAPDWNRLQVFQRTITRDDFVHLLDHVYAESPETWRATIRVAEHHADITTSTHPDADSPPFRLHFAKTPPLNPPPRYWRSPGELPVARDLENRPLEDVRIAIDPGHIGGAWARMEERYYSLGEKPVMEGQLTLTTARILAGKLSALGAEVTLVRDSEEPVTDARPDDFIPGATAGDITASERRRAQRLFYRTQEIRDRARLVNDTIRPDLTLCLHYNAESWGNPARPTLTSKNHFHLLINGCYSAGEMRLDDQRFDLLNHLLQRNHREETAVARSLADAFAEHTELPPFVYVTPNARRVDDNPFLYARNLLANRVYMSPVAFFEPYVMNARIVYKRIQAGDYEGTRTIAGQAYPSIFREYASAVADGLADYYRQARTPPSPSK